MNELMKMHYENKRREFLRGSVLGLGSIAMGSLLGCGNKNADRKLVQQVAEDINKPLVNPHFLPKAKRVIYLFQSGGPSQMELFDYKPMLYSMHGQEIPASVIGKNRISGMVSNQYSFPLAMPAATFKQHGAAGGYFSEHVPHIAEIADDICVVRSMFTEQINHEPADRKSVV